MKNFIKLNGILIFFYTLFAFPLFYFVYKYSTPYFGLSDFFDYYKLYENMDIKNTDSPLNMRLVSSFFVYCMSKTGLFYNTPCAIDGEAFSKVIYFNAILFNFMCVVTTCLVIFHLVKSRGFSTLMSFTAGLSYLLGFGTIFFEITPITDAFAVLLFAIVLQLYYKKSHFILIPLVILIIQREYVFLALGFFAFIDYMKFKSRYTLQVFLYCLVCFIIHVILRKLFFETSRYAHHTNVNFILESITRLSFPILPFIRQVGMTLNIFIIYVFVVAYKHFKNISYDKHEFLKINLLFVQLLIIAFLLALGNNSGRYFYILTPLLIVQIVNELKVFQLDKSGA